MTERISDLPVSKVHVDAGSRLGPLELWRHCPGLGGIGTRPVPPRVAEGIARLGPRLVRIFIQEFFGVYEGAGRFDWRRLDPYMAALARTGAKIVAAITLKPKALYPKIDQNVWRPNSVPQWQHVVAELVRRYSVRQELVTHWEIGNEFDCGEGGGCPYAITDPRDYAEYYRETIRPILETFPRAKVGGPANAYVDHPLMSGFVRLCRQRGLRLDFISHHLYSDDPRRHAEHVRTARSLLDGWPGRRPEVMVTEFSTGFEPASVQDQAFEPRRAGGLAAALIDMTDAGADWTFYYHLWDQACDAGEFEPFFSAGGVRNMARHWNEVPHRFGMFGVSEEVRPQYFVYWMLGRLGRERLRAGSDHQDVRVLAGGRQGGLGVLVANYDPQSPADRVVSLQFDNLQPGPRRLTVHRIDADRRWNDQTLAPAPLECRPVWVLPRFECQVLLPAGAVALVRLETPW